MTSTTSNNDTVLWELREPGIALLTLNRPERLNAWNGQLAARYFELLDRAAGDPAVKVIVVTGAGRGFCAGADMDALQDIGAGGPANVEGAAGGRDQWFTTTIPKPVIAAVNGACAGIGMVQALMCDIRFAAAGAKFTTAFSRRGLIAEYGISWILPRLIGTARSLDLLMSGRVFLAEEAAAMGLVNEVIAPEQLVDRALDYAADLAANASPTSMAVMKAQVYGDHTRSLEASSADAVSLMKASLRRPDFIEGVASFLEKRPPRFAALD
ncbi:MAG: enoyl-CoA hydratase [Actinomycetota bacterium]|nr:MAG: enoyl-CoA hydratase/carnithine racemase [Acidimicrobiaceae bacterium]